jgi:quinol monooxygenase YgiN
MKWAPVLEFLEARKADPDHLNGSPQIWHSNLVVDGFTRPTLTDAKDPLVILATLQYDGEKDVKEALSGREGAVKSTAKEEHGTLSYAIGSYVETSNRLTFVEIYESKQYLEEVHMRSEVL